MKKKEIKYEILNPCGIFIPETKLFTLYTVNYIDKVKYVIHRFSFTTDDGEVVILFSKVKLVDFRKRRSKYIIPKDKFDPEPVEIIFNDVCLN